MADYFVFSQSTCFAHSPLLRCSRRLADEARRAGARRVCGLRPIIYSESSPLRYLIVSIQLKPVALVEYYEEKKKSAGSLLVLLSMIFWGCAFLTSVTYNLLPATLGHCFCMFSVFSFVGIVKDSVFVEIRHRSIIRVHVDLDLDSIQTIPPYEMRKRAALQRSGSIDPRQQSSRWQA